MPPEPAMSPLRQTLSWAFRPLPFMQECREKLGDAFGVKFLGFETPMYMLSDPAAIKALYTERCHGLPPGRNVFLEPILGARSLLLLEGEEHMAHRKLMLPSFHGERMRALEPVVAEIVDREIDSWPLGEEFALHPRMQAMTLEVILRVVFGVAEGPRLERLRGLLRGLLAETSSPLTQLRVLATSRIRGGDRVMRRFEAGLRRDRRAALRGDRRAPRQGRPRGSRRHPLGADPGSLRERRGDDRHRPARPADDPAARRPRDDGDGARLELRPPPWPRGRPGPPARLARGGRGGLPAGDDHRVAAAAPGRAAGRPAPDQGARRRRPAGCRRGPTSPRRSGSSTPAPTSTPSRSPSAPSASSRTAPTPTPGSPTAAASAAAWAPPSPSSRCGSRCAPC